MSILKDLYYGNIKPSERYVKKESEYHKETVKLSNDIDEFIKLLNNKENELFERIIDTIYAIKELSEEECFIKGFCTGAKMMLEISNYKSNNFIDF